MKPISAVKYYSFLDDDEILWFAGLTPESSEEEIAQAVQEEMVIAMKDALELDPKELRRLFDATLEKIRRP